MPNSASFAAAGARRVSTGWRRGALLGLLNLVPLLAMAAEPSSLRLPQLESQVVASLRLKAAGAQVDSARHYLHQEQTREGLQIYAGVDIGRHKQVVTNELNRTYDAVSPHVGVSYPLLDSHAEQLRAVQGARTRVALAGVDLAATQRNVLHELRKDYVLYWQGWRSEQLALRYQEALEAKLPAARKLRAKGLWTESVFLRFGSQVAASKEDLEKSRGAQRVALSAMRAILGPEVARFAPAEPDLPKVCASGPGVGQAAERHSPTLKKLDAEFEALTYERRIGAGSGIKSDIHLGLSSIDEYSTGRNGYAATVGVDVNMPADFHAAERANADRLDSTIIANRLLSDQARRDVQADAAAAVENFQLAHAKLATTREQLGAARESLREMQMQFEHVPQVVFDELVQRLELEYQASVAEVEEQGKVLQDTNDILLLAPDSCVVEKKKS